MNKKNIESLDLTQKSKSLKALIWIFFNPPKNELKLVLNNKGQKVQKSFFIAKNQIYHLLTLKMFVGFSRISGKVEGKNRIAESLFKARLNIF